MNIIFICFGIVFARLWYLQVYKGKTLYEFSLQNRLRKEIVRAPRGMFFSRNNQILVDNVFRFDAVIIPQYLKDSQQTLKRLGEILAMDKGEITAILKKHRSNASYRPIVIKKNISRKEVSVIETENALLPGVNVETFISREYKDDQVGAHVYGYISEISQEQLPKYRKRDQRNYRQGDFIGQFGLEEQFDQSLRGENGFEFVEVDALGRKKRQVNAENLFSGTAKEDATPGHNLRLTIDRDLQLAGFEALEGKNGSVVAMDVRTGEILAMVSRPSFDPSAFGRGLSPQEWNELATNEFRPMRNRSIQDHYAPGSVFKTITLIAALEEGIVDEKTEIKCNGRFRLGRRAYHCWRRGGHGKVRAVKALRESCDVYFYRIATKLDIDILAKYARAFGLGQKTGIKLPSEVSGLVPTKEWKKKLDGVEWQLGETLSCAIGQSYMLATPIQLAYTYGAIANGGKLFNPYLVKEVFSNTGEIIKRNAPDLSRQIELNPKTLDIVRQGLYEVVNDPKGTVWWYRGQGLEMSGKTGTSQVIRMSVEKLFAKCEEKPYENRHHALFAGFAPSERPEIAVSAVVEHGCAGSKAAAPVVAAVITAYMKKNHPQWHKKKSQEQMVAFRKWYRERQRLREEAQAQQQESQAGESGEEDSSSTP